MSDLKEKAAADHPLHDADTCANRWPPDAASSPLAARLRARHPGASPAMVHRSIEDATALFTDAHVRLFLPILIERAASAALGAAMGPTSSSTTTTTTTLMGEHE